MWLKLVFLTLYLVLLFVVSRLVDIAVKTYELKSISLLPSRLVVDPVILSVKHLKKILNYRGVSYDGYIEKQQLRTLVEASGDLTGEELDELEEEEEEAPVEDAAELNETDTFKFTCGTHLNEVVEDTKDSAWIVLVKPVLGRSSLSEKIWKQVVRKANKFGIRTGVFDCAKDSFLCESKSWFSSRLLLALPREGRESREDVVLVTYLLRSNSSLRSIFNWIHEQLGRRVVSISTEAELRKKWLNTTALSAAKEEKAVLLFISSLAMPPLILSALAIKFTGRVTFAMFKAEEKQRRFNLSDADRKLPLIAVLIPKRQKMYLYTHKPGEHVSYRSIDLLLKWVKPEMNDVFYLSLVLVNLGIALHYSWMRCSKVWKHIVYWFMHLVKFNCCLFLFWLGILALSNFTVINQITDHCLHLFQLFAFSDLASVIRYDIQYRYSPLSLVVTFVLCSILLKFVRTKFSSSTIDYDDLIFRDWTPWESAILNYVLFRPMGMNIRSSVSSSIDANLEEGMELLIERLAVPNLWLQPELISNYYIKDLPVWLHPDSDQETTDNQTQSETEESTVEQEQDCDDYDHCPLTGRALQEDLKNTKHKSCRAVRKFPKQKAERERNSSINARMPEGMLALTDCAICLDPYRKGQTICGLPCGHNYHDNCIMPWLYRDNHCCPTCRWPSYRVKHKVS